MPSQYQGKLMIIFLEFSRNIGKLLVQSYTRIFSLHVCFRRAFRKYKQTVLTQHGLFEQNLKDELLRQFV